MSSFNEYIIKGDGSLHRRTITESELNMPASLADRLCASMSLKQVNVFNVQNAPVGVTMEKSGYTYFTVTLDSLMLRSPFKLIAGSLVPVFSSQTDPVLSIDWPVPAGMRLRMLIQGKIGSGGAHHVGPAWLFAVDARGTTWRLPLANVFDDCKCCLGNHQDQYVAASAQEAISKLLETFTTSQWNADLWKSPETTQSMFRFKPLKDKFEALPPSQSDWTKLCIKVAVEYSNKLAI